MASATIAVWLAALGCTLGAAVAAPGAPAATAAVPTGTTTRQTTVRTTTLDSTATDRTASEDSVLLQARTWGLTQDEVARASLLLRGLRGAFSVSNLSPIEALGIHARTPAERRRYAELFARLHHEDVERVLAWQQAYDEAVRRLYPNEPVVSFAATEPKPEVTPGMAAAAAVPMSAVRAAPPRRAASAKDGR